MKVPVTEIVINERVRCEIGDLSSLMKSMDQHGQLNPITITRTNALVAGHRRLLAALELQWTYIDAIIVDKTSEVDLLEMELEENIHRKDFSPEELLNGYRRLERLKKPPLSKRIAGFFRGIFSKLFGRKKKEKTDQNNIAEQTATASDKTDNQSGASNEPGQYGV
jgi:ParB family chromosome partitioning protein